MKWMISLSGHTLYRVIWCPDFSHYRSLYRSCAIVFFLCTANKWWNTQTNFDWLFCEILLFPKSNEHQIHLNFTNINFHSEFYCLIVLYNLLSLYTCVTVHIIDIVIWLICNNGRNMAITGVR